MKAVFLGCSLLIALPGAAQQPAQTQVLPVVPRPPARLYSDLLGQSQAAAHLLRRALAEPDDAKASALLNSEETARLMERATEVQLAFSHWVKSLPAAQQQEAVQRVLPDNHLAQLADSLDRNPKANARFERSPSLKNTVESFLYYTW